MTTKKTLYKFWETQPVPSINEVIGKDGKIIETINYDDFNNTLNEQFVISTIDINNETDINKLYSFIDNYYMETSNTEKSVYYKCHFPYNYFKWLFNDPSIINDLLITIYVKNNKSIAGCIIGSIEKIKINKLVTNSVNVRFLCVHPKLRTKGLTQVLIKELIKRSIKKGYSIGHFITTRTIPKPFNTFSLYYRPVNVKKILKYKFMYFENPNTSSPNNISSIESYYKLPKKNNNISFELLKEHQLETTCKLLNEYLEKYNYHRIFSQSEFNYIFYGNDFVTSYVYMIENEIVDFISYYKSTIKIINEDDYINIIYVYYYTSNEETIYELLKCMFSVLDKNVDIIGMYDIMENNMVLKEHLFINASKYNNYFWNYKCRNISTSQIGYVPL